MRKRATIRGMSNGNSKKKSNREQQLQEGRDRNAQSKVDSEGNPYKNAKDFRDKNKLGAQHYKPHEGKGGRMAKGKHIVKPKIGGVIKKHSKGGYVFTGNGNRYSSRESAIQEASKILGRDALVID